MFDQEAGTIQILFDDVEIVEGEKGIFGAAGRVATKLGVLDADAFARNLDGFLERIGPAFEHAGRVLGAYEMTEVEISVAVTAKGEVRLVGGVSSEVSGGIRLKFSPRPDPKR